MYFLWGPRDDKEENDPDWSKTHVLLNIENHITSLLEKCRNAENTRLQLMVSTLPLCSQMPIMLYHSVIHG